MRILVTVRCTALAAGLGGLLAIASPIMPVQSQSTGDAAAPAAVKIVELISKSFPVARTTEALAAPSTGAASVMRLREGAEIRVIGVVEGNAWYQIELPPDSRLAYVPISAIPTASASSATPSAAPSAALSAAPSAAPPAALSAAPSAAPPAAVLPDAAATTPPPTNSPPPQQAASAEEGSTIVLPPMVEFDAASDRLIVIRPTPVFIAPNPGAPQAYKIDPGRMVEVIAKSKDGAWAWVTTVDGKPAYISMADLGQVSPGN